MSSSLRPPLSIPAAGNLRSSPTVSTPTTIISCNLKHKSFTHDLASRLGLEMAVADLERLFGRSAAGGSDPPDEAFDPGRPVRVAYQGVRGSYCQDAAARAFPSPIASEAFPCFHFEDAFAALEARSADRAVVPAENSLDGPVDRNLDLLLRHDDVRIVGELVLPVNHCLLGLREADVSALRRIVSHPQALAHCDARIRDLGLETEEVACAADAARYVAENGISDTAVIGSRIAAREFGLRVIEENLQGLNGNFTRFLQLGLGWCGGGGGGAARGRRKTTVAFTLERGPSDLFRAMWGFESRGVRVTRVDHRPNRSRPVRVVADREGPGPAAYLDYVFVVDVEGRESDASIAGALARLRDFAGFVRVLGSYTCTSRY